MKFGKQMKLTVASVSAAMLVLNTGIPAFAEADTEETAVEETAAEETEAEGSEDAAAEETGAAEDTAEESTDDAAAGNTVVIYTTNDIHGVVEGDDEGTIGMVQAAAIAASTPDALLVDAGDAVQGGPFASVSLGEDVIKLMNTAGYDAMALGNHDFDYGLEQLQANMEIAEFPVISANVMKDDQLLTDGNAVIEVAGKKIGFVGLTTTKTATSTNSSLLEGVTFTDEIEAAKAQIAELKDSTDAIVLVTHMGNTDTAVKCTSGMLLDGLSDEELSEVNAVIDGHSHTIEEDTYVRNEIYVPVVQTGCNFTALGQVTLTFGEDGMVSAEGTLLDYETAMGFELTEEGEAKAAEVTAALEEIKGAQDEILGEVIASNDAPLWGGYIYWDYAEPRIVETNYGDFVTDAFVSAASAYAEQEGLSLPVIGLENGGGISATLPVGEVTRGDILNAFNHGNTVVVLKVTPAQLYGVTELGLVTTGQDENGCLLREKPSGSFSQCGGYSYTYDPAGEEGNKVVSISLADGTVLDRADSTTELLLATNSYVATAFPDSEQLTELGGEDLVVENYLKEQTGNGETPLHMPVSAGRVQIEGDVSPDTYEVALPLYDAEHAQDEEPTTVPGSTVHLRIDDGEAAEYVSDDQGIISLTLDKGPHTLYLEEAVDGQPVYVNNYSGSGTITTAAGYYRLGFIVNK